MSNKKNIIFIDPIALKRRRELEYYHGLVDIFKKHHNIFVVNEVKINNIGDIINKSCFVPDIIIFGYGVSKYGYLRGFFENDIKGMSEMNIPKIFIFLCHENLDKKLEWCRRHGITHILSEYYKITELIRCNDMVVRRLLFGTTSREVKMNMRREYDICCIGALHEPKNNGNKYNIRRSIVNYLKGRNDLRVKVLENMRLSVEEYYNLIGNTKIWVCTTSIPDGSISPRFYDVAKGKCMILCDEWEDTYEGVLSDEECVKFSKDMLNFEEKLNYYLRNEEERDLIAYRGYKRVIGNHLWEHRMMEIMDIIYN